MGRWCTSNFSQKQVGFCPFFQKYSEMRLHINIPHSTTTSFDSHWRPADPNHPVMTEALLESGLCVSSQHDVHIKEILWSGSHPFSFTQFLPPRWLLDFAPSVTQDTSIYMGRSTPLWKSHDLLVALWLKYLQALPFPYSCSLNVLTAGSRFARKLLAVIRASSGKLQGTWIVYLHLSIFSRHGIPEALACSGG